MSPVKSLSRQTLYDFFQHKAGILISQEIAIENLEALTEAQQKGSETSPHYYEDQDRYNSIVTKMANTMQAVAIAASQGKPHDTYMATSKDLSLVQGPRLQGKGLERLREHMMNMEALDASPLFVKTTAQPQKQLATAQAA